MAFRAPVARGGRGPENWVINFAGSTAGALGSTSTKAYGTVYRTQGAQSVNTGTLPFALSKNEAGIIVDLFINAAVANSGDAQFDIEISSTSQKLFWDIPTMLFTSNSRPRLPAPGIYLPPQTQIAFSIYWIVGQTTASSVNVIALVQVSPVRG